jgi:hypothetical protein
MKLGKWKILTTGAIVTGLAIGGTTAFASENRSNIDAIHLEDVTTPAALDGGDRGLVVDSGALTIGIDSPESAASVDSVGSPNSPVSVASVNSPNSPASPASVDSVDSPNSPASPVSVNSPASAASVDSVSSPGSADSADSSD